MAVTVVLKHPRRHLLLRARRQLLAFWGGTLFVVGILATSLAFGIGVAFVMAGVSGGGADGNPWLEQMLLAFGISIPIAIVGVRVGLRVLRGERGLVLFLRRFGQSDTTKAVTFAARKTVGGSWRLVTLDDEQIAPLGIPAGARRAYGAATLAGRAWLVFLQLPEFILRRVIPITLGATLAVLALEFLRAGFDWRAARQDGTVAPYEDTLRSLIRADIPFDAIEWSLPGVFAVVATLVAVEVAAMFVLLFAVPALAVLTVLLFPVIYIIQTSSESAKKAEESTRQPIFTKADIWPATQAAVQASRGIFAPRLIVLKVATPVWRQTVTGFAAVCSTPLIDLSDVSENVLWEIEEMTRRFGPRCLFVGRHDRVAWLADPPTAGLGPSETRLLRLLDGHQVLAYTTDWRGRRRFARSLRAKLLDRPLRPSGSRLHPSETLPIGTCSAVQDAVAGTAFSPIERHASAVGDEDVVVDVDPSVSGGDPSA